jgi:hypothetical protein
LIDDGTILLQRKQFAALAALQFFGSYRTNNGHHRTLSRRGSVAIDPLPPSAIQSSCVAVFLFDQLVRAQQDRCRHIEAKRLGGLHIEHGLVFRSNFARSSPAISLAKLEI